MPSYTTQERVELIMRVLHKSQSKRLKTIDIAQMLGLPQPSVNKTINQDYPECFEKDPFGKGWILTGLPPHGTTWDDFDLEPVGKKITTTVTTVEDMPDSATKITKVSERQMKAEHFQNGWDRLPEGMRKRIVAIMDSDELFPTDEDYWKAWNFYSAGIIALKLARSHDKHAKLKELVNGDVKL